VQRAAEPVAQAAAPIVRTAEPVAQAAAPVVRRAVEPVAQTAAPVTSTVVQTAAPLLETAVVAARPVTGTAGSVAQPLVETAAKALEPAAKAGGGVVGATVGSVPAPAAGQPSGGKPTTGQSLAPSTRSGAVGTGPTATPTGTPAPASTPTVTTASPSTPAAAVVDLSQRSHPSAADGATPTRPVTPAGELPLRGFDATGDAGPGAAIRRFFEPAPPSLAPVAAPAARSGTFGGLPPAADERGATVARSGAADVRNAPAPPRPGRESPLGFAAAAAGVGGALLLFVAALAAAPALAVPRPGRRLRPGNAPRPPLPPDSSPERPG
jgi:hypothetical protein